MAGGFCAGAVVLPTQSAGLEGCETRGVRYSYLVGQFAGPGLVLEGIVMAIVEARTLKRVGERLILASVKKTGRLIISAVACKSGGRGAEIASRVVGAGVGFLKAPIRRVNFI